MRHRPPAGASYWQPAERPDEPDVPDNEKPDRSRAVLVLGVVSLLVGPLGIVAWALANRCLHGIAAGQLDPSGEVNARAARVLGIVATCMFLLKLFALLPLYVFAFGG